MKKYHALLFLSCFFYLFSCKNKVEAISPKKTNISESVYASGFVKSENQYEVYTKVNGVVKTIMVKEGAYVKKGDPIFQIENPNSKLNAENARLAAQANDYTANQSKLKDAKNAIELAKKRRVNDSLNFARQQELWSQNIGSKLDLEQKEFAYENAKVNLKNAQLAYEDINRQLKLASEQSKNNLKMAQENESDLTIRSEVDGFVYRINVEQGELATSMSPLAVIGQKNFVIELNIDEFDIVKISPGQKVIIRMDSYQAQSFEAVVSYIYPMMNERTRTFIVEAVFSEEPKQLYPNLTLEASIIIHDRQNVLTIPTRFLLNDSTVLLQDGTERAVKVGLKDYTLSEIRFGIDEKDKISMPKK